MAASTFLERVTREVRGQVDTNTLACTYAALICYDDGLPVNAENIASLIKASECEVSSFWPKLFCSAIEGEDLGKLITQVGGGDAGDAAPAAGGGAAPAAGGDAGKKEDKKKAAPAEEDEDMGFSLFD